MRIAVKKAFLLLIAALICLVSACTGGVNTTTGSPSDTLTQTLAEGAETAGYSPEPETGTEGAPASGSSETASRQDAAADEAPASAVDPEPESVAPPPGQQTEVPDKASAQTPEQTPDTVIPYSTRTADTVLEIGGGGAEKTCYFSMDDLRAMADGYFEDDYFSRRTGPEEAVNRCGGILLSYLLEDVVGLKEGAKKVTVTSSDGYASAFSLSAVKAPYINEKDPSKTLYMILAWEMDGKALTDSGPLMLVMGQQIEGEYNRQNWVKDVCSIEVKAP